MALKIRGGLEDDFDRFKLVARELAITYSGKMFFCYSAGNVKQLATVEDLQSMLNASATSYTALQQLIADLELNPNELTNILANISALQTSVNELNSELTRVAAQTILTGADYPASSVANQIFYKII